ncbi:hypothetical protein LFZ14_13300 [Salmonella enterica subsp. enterica serovar Hillingdon str. N1529-D3]|nr:hypothetical protein LFZ14_13300 [Salmonella enterica subsp. enterica serovar Hillingdon str. N1529-D3]
MSDKLLKSRCDAAFSSPSRGGVYYAFLFLSQAFIFAFLTDFLTKPSRPGGLYAVVPCQWWRIIGSY